jgi:riboflavin kinase, archaea type
MILMGIAVSGLGKAQEFTQLSWVREELLRQLNIRPYPGTFNVRLSEPAQLERWEALKRSPGIALEEPAGTSCVAVCYPVLVNEAVTGAILVPGVLGYPTDQVEIVAGESVRSAIGARDGDPITLRVLE